MYQLKNVLLISLICSGVRVQHIRILINMVLVPSLSYVLDTFTLKVASVKPILLLCKEVIPGNIGVTLFRVGATWAEACFFFECRKKLSGGVLTGLSSRSILTVLVWLIHL